MIVGNNEDDERLEICESVDLKQAGLEVILYIQSNLHQMSMSYLYKMN